MHAAVDAHFAAWEQDANSMQNAAIRDAALRRRDEARTRTGALDPVSSKVATSFDAYVADLTDIEKLLAVDLSPGGVSAATRSVRNVSTEASQVKAALKELESTVSEVRETLAVKQASAPAAVSAR
jgi:hypothetical protein